MSVPGQVGEGEVVVLLRGGDQGVLNLRGEAERGHEAGPQRVLRDRRGDGGDTPGDLGDPGDREVASPRLGPVAGFAGDVQPTLCRTLLPHGDDHGLRPVGDGQMRAAGLGDAVTPVEHLRVFGGQPLRAETATGFLVRDTDEGKCPTGRTPGKCFPCDLTGHHGHRRSESEHVDRAATVDPGVRTGALDLCAERVSCPVGSVHRNDVGVTEEGQRLGGRIGTGHGDDDAGAPRARLQSLDGHRAGVATCGDLGGEKLLETVGVAHLLAGVRGEVVDAGVADQGLQQCQGIVEEGHFAASEVEASSPSGTNQ